MKIFSVISIVLASSLIGYFIIIGLPEIAKINPISNKVVSDIKHDGQSKKEELILRDKCNSYVASAIFSTASQADNFIDSCMAGNETSKINVIKNIDISATTTVETTGDRMTSEELSVKCKEFMTRARFETQNDADNFLKNCLAGN